MAGLQTWAVSECVHHDPPPLVVATDGQRVAGACGVCFVAACAASARFDLRFHAARVEVERQGRPDDWRVDRDEWEAPLKKEARRMAGFVVNRCRCALASAGSEPGIRIAGHARFVRAGRGFRRRLGDVATVAWPRLGIARIAAGMRIGCRWCRPVTLGHLSSPVRTPRRGSPTACSRPAIPKFPSPPSHPLPASASSGSAAGNRRLR